ncbi:MAG: hypothetical protein PHF86_14990 [Candidatus Nanoarchaeia archaeon]|jgi:predicted protein tyrosine phosphatase|nr:hypothetical protein [Candidatus Nanoarchaeia archaeon]
MIKHIYTKSRREVEHAIITGTRLSKQTWALISIWSGEELVTPFKNRETLARIGCPEALSVRFSDVTKDEFEKRDLAKNGCVLFTEEAAKEIVKFVNKINDMEIPDLFIHCAAGISRSPAVGLFTCKYLNLDEAEFRKANPHILPNFYVLNILNQVSGINSNYTEFWMTQENIEKRNKLAELF